jgi:NAD(P)-dependent dehydrogenase (short-subunit alcohol dehydrogenase family)
MRLEGLVALVTGAAQGIGAAIAREFAGEGAVVVCIDRKPEIEAVAAAIRKSGGEARAYAFDITDYDSYRRSVEEAGAKDGRIDVLVNNAAISIYGDVTEDTLENWRLQQRVNLEALYMGSKLVVPWMARRKSGRIINLASAQAIATEGRLGAYTASKGAIMSYTKSLAVELAPHGILVNAIAPGCIHTPMSIIDGVDETETESFREWYVKRRKIPLARPGEPEEVARVAVFLASRDASYITGHTLVVDGGLTITF